MFRSLLSFQFFVLFFLNCSAKPQQSPQLDAVRTSASLPTPRAHTAAHFDGLDSVYIFGGMGNGPTNDILKYSISNDSIQLLGNHRSLTDAGTVVSQPDGSLYFLGGEVFSTTIHRFSPNNPEFAIENVTTTSRFSNFLSSAVKLDEDSDNFFVFGGYWEGDLIFRCDPHVEDSMPTTELIGTLPRAFYGAAVSDGAGLAYLFGNPYGSNTWSDVFAVNLTTFEVTQASDPLPPFWGTHTAVWTGQGAVIIGGYIDASSGSIIRFDPTGMRHQVVRVTDFPQVPVGNIFYGTSAVYVERLDRVYFFGGMSSPPGKQNEGEVFDGIWYIDLQSGQ